MSKRNKKNRHKSKSKPKARANYLLQPVFDVLEQYGCNQANLYHSNVLVQTFNIFKQIGFLIAPDIEEWANNRMTLTKLNNTNNPKHAGRNMLDSQVLFYCYLIMNALALSAQEMVCRLANDNFVKSILCAFCDRELATQDLPSARSLTKYCKAFYDDGIVAKLDYYFAMFMNKMSLGVETDPARQKGWEESLKVIAQTLTEANIDLKELKYGVVVLVDSAFICLDVNHLSIEERKLLQAGNSEELMKRYPKLAALHKRMSLCSWGQIQQIVF